MTSESHHLHQPVLEVARKDVAALRQDFTVQQALDVIRQQGVGEKIVYFYVVDADDRLAGVLPTRRLLTATVSGRWSRSWEFAQWVGKVSVVSGYQPLAVAADSDSFRRGSS